MKITSSAFEHGQRIPHTYTCDGADVNPPLRFDDIPPGAVSLALVIDDPDAPGGVWEHWVVWNMPARTRELAEAKPAPGVVGRNSWKRNAYGGPCPPDREHRYLFTLYALDTDLQLGRDANARELADAMRGHVLARAELMGRYARNRRPRR